MSALFEVRNLYKSYSAKCSVLEDISFSVERNGILCILGINGAGKATLIKCMLGLLRSSGGKILYQNVPLHKITQKKYYKEVSAVLEGNRNTYWYLTGWQNIQYFGRQKGLSGSKLSSRAVELLKLFDLYDSKDEKVCNYSRGMQQKLSVIISLLMPPRVLFLDEPTLGLDFVTQRTMVELLGEISKNVAIILTSHHLDVVDQLADDLVLLENKGIRYQGSAKEFKESHSSGKWTISVAGELSDGLNFPDDALIFSSKDISKIIILNNDTENFKKTMHLLLNNNAEILGVKKDSSTIEDILLHISGGENDARTD